MVRRIISQSPETGHECSFCKSIFFTLHECTYSDEGFTKEEMILKCARCGETVRARTYER
jgi:hypothetical protein